MDDLPDPTRVPTRYILSDSDDDEYYPTPDTAPPPSPIVVRLAPSVSPETRWTLVVGVYGGGNALLASVKEKEPVGAVIVPGIDLKQGSLDLSFPDNPGFILHRLASSSSSTLLLPCNSSLSPSQSVRFVRSLCSHLKFQRVILLDTFPPSSYTEYGPHIRPPFLRILRTTTAENVEGLALYEPPNLAKNLTAAFLSHCEIHNIPALALLSLLEISVGRALPSEDCLEALREGLKKAGVKLNVNLLNWKSEARREASRLYL